MIFNQLIPGELIQNQNIIIYITSIRTSENLYAYQVINLSKVVINLSSNAKIKGCGSQYFLRMYKTSQGFF